MLGWIAFPPMVVNLWLFGITRVKKYLKVFSILLCYYPLAFILFAIVTKMSFKGA